MTPNKPLPERPRRLYTFEQLYRGFDVQDQQSFVATKDFKRFRRFVKDGMDAPMSLHVRRRQAEHDAYISNALRRYLDKKTSDKTKLVGVMGSHSLAREHPAYRTIATLSREIARNNFLIISGGGPGAMEAAHLGAMFSTTEDNTFQEALNKIAGGPNLPNLRDLVERDGSIASNRERDIASAHEWVCAALKVKSLAAKPRGDSLAIPTYRYGEEPITSFATQYAKYYQNSIREEALVTEGRAGVIYARGSGGTLREIFEDFEQNYYTDNSTTFTPMIFVDPDGYWENDAEFDPMDNHVTRPAIKIDVTIRSITKFARAKPKDADQCNEKILFTTDTNEILKTLKAQSPMAEARMKLLLSGNALVGRSR